jgi:hypothetical protein
MTTSLSLEHKRFNHLMQAQSNSKTPRSDNSLTFDRLRAKCDDLQRQIEDAWTQAKTESFSRCHTLEEILKGSQVETVWSWRKHPEYLRFQTRLMQIKQTHKHNPFARQKSMVENVLNESKDSLVPLKALLSPIRRLSVKPNIADIHAVRRLIPRLMSPA